MAVTQDNLNHWFSYHSPTADQIPKYLAIREAGKKFAEAILENCPSSADQTVAIRKVRETVMVANQAIACKGE